MKKLNRYRALPILLVVMGLGACAGLPSGEPAGGTAPKPRVRVSGVPSGPVYPALTEDVLYDIIVAEIAGQRGEISVALRNYVDLAERLDDVKIAERATRIAVFARENEIALKTAQRWLELDPESLEARQIIGAMNIRLGDVDAALAQLEYILSNSEGDADNKLRMIANFLGREQDKETALTVMERLVAKRQDDPEALFAYALLAIRTEHMDRAREVMERLVPYAPENISVAMAYLSVLQKQDETQAALSWLEEALDSHPEQFDLRLMYARLLADARRYDESREQFKILSEAAPENADVRYALGLLYLQANDLATASTEFQKLISMDQRVNEAAFYLGQIAQSENRYDEALRWYREVQGGANYFDSQLHIGLLLSRQGKIREAQAHLHSITARNREEQLRIIRAEGEILTEQGDLDAAMAVYDRALKEEYDTELMYTRAMLAEKMNRVDLLERDLREILQHEPDNAQALNALGYTLADRTERYDEAHTLIQRALELKPDDFYILDSMGWVLYRLGRLEEAVEYLRRARAIKDDPEVAAHLGEVLWVMGDKQGARDVWESALQTTPDDETLLNVIERLGP